MRHRVIFDHILLDEAIGKGVHVEVHDSGALAAPTGLDFEVTVTAKLFGPYEQAG